MIKSYNKIGPLIFCASLLISCSDKDANFSLYSDSESFIQDSQFNNKLDILFVIDDQPSMSSFQDELVESFATFMDLFFEKGFDYRIAVVTTSGYMADPTLNGYNALNVDAADFNDYNGTVHSFEFVITPDTPNVLTSFAINAKPRKNSAGQDVRAFSSFRQALQSDRPINSGFLREDAYLAIVIVDNQDDFSGNGRCNGCNVNQRYNAPTLDPVSDYVTFLDELTGTNGARARYSVSAMTQSATPCQGGTNMIRIMELVELTGGVTGDICQPDFGASMVLMADNIATLSTMFHLDRVPVVSSIVVKVDGKRVPKSDTNGWSYVQAANAIAFHGSAIPSQGSKIGVDYDPVTVL